MARSRTEHSRVSNALALLCLCTLCVSAFGVFRSVTARGDSVAPWQGPFGASVANADLHGRCGADVVFVVDLGTTSSDPAGASALGAAVEAGAEAFFQRGSRVAVLGYGEHAKTLRTGGAAGFVESVALDGESAETKAKALAAALTSGASPASNARNWEAGLREAESLAATVPGGRPLLVIHVAGGGPDRHLENRVSTGEPSAADPARVAAAADSLRAGPITHLYGVQVGTTSPSVQQAMVGAAGPDIVTFGQRPIAGATDDVVIVADPGQLANALVELAATSCLTTLDLRVLADSDDGRGAISAPVELTTPVGQATTLLRTPAQQLTDSTGQARWVVTSVANSPFILDLADLTAGPDEHRVALCTDARGALVASGGLGGRLRFEGVQPGTEVLCELRLTEAGPARPVLGLRHTASVDGPADCGGSAPQALLGVAVGAVGRSVSHCLTVSNLGSQPLHGVTVTAEGLGLGLSTPWRIDGDLQPGTTVSRLATVVLDMAKPIEAVATADPILRPGPDGTTVAMRPRATATVAHQVLPPGLDVQRALTSDGAPTCGVASPSIASGQRTSFCYTLHNVGGTKLDQITILDPAISAIPLTEGKTLRPGESTTLTGSAIVRNEAAVEIVATARPLDEHGEGIKGRLTVSSKVDPNSSGLSAEQAVSAETVAPGTDVTVSVTVTNSAPTPLKAVTVRSTVCGELIAASSRVSDNGDSQLDRGEAWVYSCTKTLSVETEALAVVAAQDSGTTTTRPARVRVEAANLKMKVKQTNDLRVGSRTTYVLEVDNNGSADATDVVVLNPLNPLLTFVSATPNTGSCSLVNDDVSCSLGTIPPETNGRNTITLVVAAKAEGLGQTIANQARATTAVPDFNGFDNVATAYGSILAPDQCEGSRECTPSSVPVTTPSDETPTSQLSDLRGSSVTPANSVVEDSRSVNELTRLASTGAGVTSLIGWSAVFVAAGLGLVALSDRRRLLHGIPA